MYSWRSTYFGVDATAGLAGLGIGGIAVALAAQKTLENVIGGFSLVFDKALRVGDVLKLGEIVGTVDQIGLRSTRIRTVDRTILSVPNGQIATVNIETLSDRDKFWFRHVVGLRYETTPAQIRTIISEMHDLLRSQPEADLDSVRVRFLRIGSVFARRRAGGVLLCERLESVSRNPGTSAPANHGNRGPGRNLARIPLADAAPDGRSRGEAVITRRCHPDGLDVERRL